MSKITQIRYNGDGSREVWKGKTDKRGTIHLELKKTKKAKAKDAN